MTGVDARRTRDRKEEIEKPPVLRGDRSAGGFAREGECDPRKSACLFAEGMQGFWQN